MGDLTERLQETGALAFEELAFVYTDREVPAERRAIPATAEVRVGFRGPMSGELLVRVHGELLATLATNMLGEVEPPADRLQRDALGEIANVICGNLLPAVGGASNVFRLDAPAVRDLRREASSAPSGRPMARAELALGDDGWAELELYVEPPSADGGGER
jgi:CheY-specific phosphatase CheX